MAVYPFASQPVAPIVFENLSSYETCQRTDKLFVHMICSLYRVAQLKWGQLTFLMVTFECTDKNTGSYSQKNIIINSKANKYQQNYKQTILP